MSDSSDVVTRSAQLGETESTWGKTPRQLAAEYNPDKKKSWPRASIERAALELAQLLPSRSRFRTTDDPIDTLAGLAINIDARVHEYITVYYAVELGDADSIAILRASAAKGDTLAVAAIAKVDAK